MTGSLAVCTPGDLGLLILSTPEELLSPPLQPRSGRRARSPHAQWPPACVALARRQLRNCAFRVRSDRQANLSSGLQLTGIGRHEAME